MKTSKFPLIFIVEDNSVYSKLIVSHLRSHKFINCESFTSGEACLKGITREPDIIILDYLMNGMNGLDVLIATKKRSPTTDFIFLSGQDSIEVAIDCIKYGAYDYIVKDEFALIKLSDKINKLIALRELVASNRLFKKGITIFGITVFGLILLFLFLAIVFPSILTRS
ncbi:MAG: response regulator [Bacteroidia bacterium]|nr:response regulator [Bacteroidia bacterium]